ncbi:hypothetical protein ACXJJ3_14200 [Kribbella sp. WER1]
MTPDDDLAVPSDGPAAPSDGPAVPSDGAAVPDVRLAATGQAGRRREAAYELPLEAEADHRQVQRVLVAAGWTPCGAGDWAIALRSPDGLTAARISPFDPVGPYTAALYREAAYTGQVPRLYEHRRLSGGGDLQILEWLSPVAANDAAAFHRSLAAREPALAELADVVRQVHERGLRELPWFGPNVDDNPDNVMRTADGRLVAADLFSADGPRLYDAVLDDPDLVAATIPEDERRFMTELPMTNTGPWPAETVDTMRSSLAAADTRRCGSAPG